MEAILPNFRHLIRGDELIVAPCALNPIMARIAEDAGFKAVYMSGGSLGWLKCVTEANITLPEMAEIAVDIRAVCRLPIILDAGGGWGDPMHLHRTIALTEAAGFSAIEIEDQLLPRRVEHHIGIDNLVDTGLMVDKIKEAIAARTDPDLVVIARTNTRRVRRALRSVFGGEVGKDTVSRVWRKVKGDWDAWNSRSLADEPIVRLILDGTVVRVRLDRKATSISLLVVIGVRTNGQKVLLAIKQMGGESTEAWRTVLDDLIKRGLRRPELLIVDGGTGLESAIAAVWDSVPVQRCTVHKHRNLLAHAPERLHEEISDDYNDMIYAATREEIEKRRKAFIRKWRLKHRAVADSLEEAGDRLFTFTRLPQSQWRSVRTTNAIERLHEEFKRRIKTQTVLPSADTAAMLFWALLASGQINMRKVDGWQTLATKPMDQKIDLAA